MEYFWTLYMFKQKLNLLKLMRGAEVEKLAKNYSPANLGFSKFPA